MHSARTEIIAQIQLANTLHTNLTYLERYSNHYPTFKTKAARRLFATIHKSIDSILANYGPDSMNDRVKIGRLLSQHQSYLELVTVIPSAVYSIATVSGWFQRYQVSATLINLRDTLELIDKILKQG